MARGDGGGRDGRGEPEWRPVGDVDMMTAVVLEQLGANREQLRTLEPARRSPHLLDDHTVERIKQVFGEQRDDMWLWVETGERWQCARRKFHPRRSRPCEGFAWRRERRPPRRWNQVRHDDRPCSSAWPTSPSPTPSPHCDYCP
jgi:hypothetical protein